jgi:hypothetical protein
LPEIARTISERKCYHTGKGNFFTIDLQLDDSEKFEYEIYFQISRAKKGKLRLFVESAYIRDDEHSTSSPQKNKIGFFVIAFNRLKNKEIKMP